MAVEQLHAAVLQRSASVVQQCLQAGASTVNSADACDATPLHIAVWRNHLGIIDALLEAGADVDAQDGESGWTPLHRALYWGNIHAAARLLEAGAALNVADLKGRTPLDLLSAELAGFLRPSATGGGTSTDVFAWGNGANYGLGTGSTSVATAPARLDALRRLRVTTVAAAKFHSVALIEDGRLFSWGFGRGGRTGHPDFDIYSGESAAILPRLVAGLAKRVVTAVAAAKHHTAAVTDGGEVWTWGSNRDGRLGYPAVDTQPTPRRVTTLRQRAFAVAAANKHTAALVDGGAVFSWGANAEGQLGYGTSDSASNAVPRFVEGMKGKQLVSLAAAKRHTVVLTADGDVYTWGHRVVTPRRVGLAGARDVSRASAAAPPLAFHKGQTDVSRPRAVRIAAGAAHTSCLTQDGVVLAWRSADPELVVQEVGGPVAGKTIVDVSAGKYRTAVVTSDGDIFMWEGWSKPPEAGAGGAAPRAGCGGGGKDFVPHAAALGKSPDAPRHALQRRNKLRAHRLLHERIVPARVEGLKRATAVCVGEKHSLALQSWWCAPAPVRGLAAPVAAVASLETRGSLASALEVDDGDDILLHELEDSDWSRWAERMTSGPASRRASVVDDIDAALNGLTSDATTLGRGAPTLQALCERAVATRHVEPRTALEVLHYADAAGAGALKRHCLAVALANLDAVVVEARAAVESLPAHLLDELEGAVRAHLSRGQAASGANPLSPRSPASSCRVAGSPPRSGRPTAALADVGDEEADADSIGRSSGIAQQLLRGSPTAAEGHAALRGAGGEGAAGSERSFRCEAGASEAAAAFRLGRHVRKKLQQIEALERRRGTGGALDEQQAAKVAQRAMLEAALAALTAGRPAPSVQRMLDRHATPIAAAADAAAGGKAELPSGLDASHGTPPGKPEAAPNSSKGVGSESAGGRGERRSQPRAVRTGVDVSGPSTAVSSFADASAMGQTPPAALAGFAATPLSSSRASRSGMRRAGSGAVSPATSTHGFEPSGAGSVECSPMMLPAPQPAAERRPADLSLPSRVPASAGKPQQRKGGLSMFLSGGLEAAQAPPAPITPAPAPRRTHSWATPAATAEAVAKPAAVSLLDIQQAEAAAAAAAAAATRSPATSLLSGALKAKRQQAQGSPGPSDWDVGQPPHAASETAGASNPAAPVSDWPTGSGARIPLSQFINSSPSTPIPVASAAAWAPPAAEATPAWGGASGSSPPGSTMRPSLRQIQEAQQQHRDNVSASWGYSASGGGAQPGSHGGGSGPGTSLLTGAMAGWQRPERSPAGVSALGSSPGARFPAGTSPSSSRRAALPERASKWYVPEEHVVTPLLDIQTEELAATLAADEAAAAAAAASASSALPGTEAGEGAPDSSGGSKRRQKPRRDGGAAKGPPHRKRRPRTPGADASPADGGGRRESSSRDSQQTDTDKPSGGGGDGGAQRKPRKNRPRQQQQVDGARPRSPAPALTSSAQHEGAGGERTVAQPQPQGANASHEQQCRTGGDTATGGGSSTN